MSAVRLFIQERSNMKKIFITCFSVLILCPSCKDSPTDNNKTESSIEINNLIPEPGSVITSHDTLTASLLYSISDDIQSDFGFSISIKFVSIIEGQTFSVGPNSQIEVMQKEGNVTLEYPLELIWNHQNLKHPISCYFYLHKMTSETTSTVIARTVEINYNE